MSGVSQKEALGAHATTNVQWFDAADLVIVKTGALADERATTIELTETFLEDIDANGVETPLKIRRGKGERDKAGHPILEVVDGRERLRAVIEVNKRRKLAKRELLRVPCQIVRPASDQEAFEMMVRLNQHRFEDQPIVLARKMARYQQYGKSIEEIAQLFNRSQHGVVNAIKLLDMPDEVQEAVAAKDIAPGLALDVAALPPEVRKEVLSVPGRKTKARIQAATGRDVGPKAPLKRGRAPKATKPAVPSEGPKMRTRAEVQAKRDEFAKDGAAGVAIVMVLDWVLMIEGSQ